MSAAGPAGASWTKREIYTVDQRLYSFGLEKVFDLKKGARRGSGRLRIQHLARPGCGFGAARHREPLDVIGQSPETFLGESALPGRHRRAADSQPRGCPVRQPSHEMKKRSPFSSSALPNEPSSA